MAPTATNICEVLELLLHRVRKIVIFGRHEATEAKPVFALERPPKNLWIPVQSAARIGCFCQYGVEITHCVFPVAPRYGRTEVGLAGKMMINARGLKADLGSEVAEVQADVTVRLRSLSGGRQDRFLGVLCSFQYLSSHIAYHVLDRD
jgi:hypothetical protein